MPFCPKCGYEYRPEIETCPDCGEKLVEALAQEREAQDAGVKLVSVASYPYEPAAQMAKLKLAQHGIRSFLRNEKMAQTDIVAVFADSGVKVLVAEPDAARAREILETD